MDAPKCKLCGERHYGACPSFEAPRAKVTKPRNAEPKPKPAPIADPSKTWRRGRRIAGEAHLVIAQQKPWLALGMSRATYYRRKRKGEIPAGQS